MNPKHLFTSLFLTFFFLSSCSSLLNDTTSGQLPEDTSLRKSFELVTSLNTSPELSCDYGSQSYSSEQNLIGAVVYGLGERPSSVTVQNDGMSAELPSITAGSTPDSLVGGGWTASGKRLNCSILGCLAGTYRVLVNYPEGFSSCPLKVSFELKAPPS